jgi:hypothetical protein
VEVHRRYDGWRGAAPTTGGRGCEVGMYEAAQQEEEDMCGFFSFLFYYY